MTVFTAADRVQHMMYRLFDPAHPLYDPALSETTITWFGKKIKLKDSIPEIYRHADRIVGEVMDRVRSGALGRNVVVLVLSDHGCSPFYYGVNLNNLLVEKGFMHLADRGQSITIDDIQDFDESDFLYLVDWTRTQAYSLGLGKIFINLEGREPNGIVTSAQYESVRSDIIRELECYVDSRSDRKVVVKAWRREEIFEGPYWKEGEADFIFNGVERERRYTDGFADIFIGFDKGYRVSWRSTLGGLETKTIVANDSNWCADHVSVAPELVPGVLLSNAKICGGPADIAPTILGMYGIEIPEDMDGKAIPLGL